MSARTRCGDSWREAKPHITSALRNDDATAAACLSHGLDRPWGRHRLGSDVLSTTRADAGGRVSVKGSTEQTPVVGSKARLSHFGLAFDWRFEFIWADGYSLVIKMSPEPFRSM
jgi:hypothetical protein